MADKLTAKQRKEQAAAKERAKSGYKPKGRRSSRVTTFVSEKAKVKRPKKRAINPAFIPKMGKPVGLSPEARFEELRPDCISPLDWFRLFTPDESIWPELVEEAVEAVEAGEIAGYPDDGPANVSRRRLREAMGG